MIVTHDIAVGRRADRIVRMLDGRVVAEEQLEAADARRVTLLEIDVLGRLADAVAMFQAEVMPEPPDQEGYQGVYVLTTPEGRPRSGRCGTRPSRPTAGGRASIPIPSPAT